MTAKQWKPDRRRKVHRDAKKAGLKVVYDALDIPPEPKGQRVARETWLSSLEWQNREDETSVCDIFDGEDGASEKPSDDQPDRLV